MIVVINCFQALGRQPSWEVDLFSRFVYEPMLSCHQSHVWLISKTCGLCPCGKKLVWNRKTLKISLHAERPNMQMEQTGSCNMSCSNFSLASGHLHILCPPQFLPMLARTLALCLIAFLFICGSTEYQNPSH